MPWCPACLPARPACLPCLPACRDGDEYIGSRWNELTMLYLVFLAVPLAGLAFAWATYGTLWATGEFY